MDASKLLAKGTGETLIDHSKLVARFSQKLYAISAKEINSIMEEAVKLAALLHDIGKCTNWFQKMVLTTDGSESKKKSYIDHRHNEVGWAFLSKYLDVDDKVLDHVRDAVYWHHGITQELAKHTDSMIVAKLKANDIKNMSAFLVAVCGDKYLLKEPRSLDKTAPLHFNREQFNEGQSDSNLLIRSCIISGDRMASSVPIDTNDETIDRMISKAMTRSGDMTVTTDRYAGPRFEEQWSIAKTEGRTKLAKAPAGYGKTVVGLLWASISDRRIIWVCPRNMVAESVYHSIMSDMQAMGMDISIELFLSGEVKKSHKASDVGFTADIIVTNIDSFLFPSIKNAVAERQFLINNCDVVFDEFHEIISENAMFAAFVNTMRCRHRLCNGRTLLLSATPMNMTSLWDSFNEKTIILPKDTTHYSAVHSKPYEVNVVNDVSLNGGANLIISNAISTSQNMKSEHQCGVLVHSKFNDARRQTIYDETISEFGKQSERHANKNNVSATHVLQAALDVSFMNLYESILSPESTLQRIGRCNRWGDNPNTSKLFFRFEKLDSERKVRDIIYDNGLSNAWYDRLKTIHGKHMTLDEFYMIYNDHYKKEGSRILSWIRSKLNDSTIRLQAIFPYQHSNSLFELERNIINANSNGLRSNGNQIFFIAKNTNGNGWTDPMSHTIRESIEQDFNEDLDSTRGIERAIEEIDRSGDKRYVYGPIIKRMKKANRRFRIQWSKLSRMSNTPYPCFNMVYDEEFGLIKSDQLTSIKTNNKTQAA